MPRIDVPEDYDSDVVSVSGTDDSGYSNADVSLEDVRHARDLSVRQDSDGRYVGCSEHYADAVREFLGVSGDIDTDTDTDAETETEICGADLSQGGTCERPADECPYHGGSD